MALSMVGPSTTALMIAQGKVHRFFFIFENFLAQLILKESNLEHEAEPLHLIRK